MKKITSLLVAIAVLFLASCGQSKLEDGVYFAQEENWDGEWKYQVVITVEDNTITKAEWNGIPNIAGGIDKKTTARTGLYGMGRFAQNGEWDLQAKAVEDYLVRTQNYKFSSYNSDGVTDAITGASISVDGFFKLVRKAISSKPVNKGSYKNDGWYYAEEDDFEEYSGWKDTVLVTIVNGSIVDVLWNSISSDEDLQSKIVESMAGRYGMENVAKQGPWHEQTKRVEAALVKAQDPIRIRLKPDGTSDAISGATITLNSIQLVQNALEKSK